MHASRLHRRAIVPLMLIVAAIAFLGGGRQSASAAVAQLPFTVTNNSGRGDATYVYVIARNSAGSAGICRRGRHVARLELPVVDPERPGRRA